MSGMIECDFMPESDRVSLEDLKKISARMDAYKFTLYIHTAPGYIVAQSSLNDWIATTYYSGKLVQSKANTYRKAYNRLKIMIKEGWR